MPSTLPTPRAMFLVLYWLAFACLAAVAATDPGYAPRWLPLPPFPWFGLVAVWTMLGLGVFGLHIVFGKPWTYRRRLLVALGAYGTLAFLFVVTWVTDNPGLACVPGWFVLLTFIGLVVLGIAHAIASAACRFRSAP